MSDWRPTREEPLLLLAMDHRASLGKTVYGVVDDAPTQEQVAAMETGKQAVYDGLTRAVASLTGGRAGVLVDERYGSAVVQAARQSPDTVLAVPIEHSGQEWFGLEWGGPGGVEWTDHLSAIRPDYAKVLVRDNPDFDVHERHAQLTHLQTVADLLRDLGIPLLYELLVPATGEQKSAAGGDSTAYDRDIRPELVSRLIAENYEHGVVPALWKIEGLETADAAREIVSAARAGGRDVDCIVLGRDAPTEQLDHWLSVAAPVEGFVGFAIGRSIWEQAVKDSLAGTIGPEGVAPAVAERYLHFATTYLSARDAG